MVVRRRIATSGQFNQRAVCHVRQATGRRAKKSSGRFEINQVRLSC